MKIFDVLMKIGVGLWRFLLVGFCLCGSGVFAQDAGDEPKLRTPPELVGICRELDIKINKLKKAQKKGEEIDEIKLKLLEDEREEKCSYS